MKNGGINIVDFPAPHSGRDKLNKEINKLESHKKSVDKILRNMSAAAYYNEKPRYTPAWFASIVEEKGLVGKAGVTFLRLFARTLRQQKHWGYASRITISKKGKASRATITRGQRQAKDADLALFHRRYGPTKRLSGKSRPSQKPPLIWLHKLTLIELHEIDGVDYSGVDPLELYEKISDKARSEIGHKIPQRKHFITPKK